MRINKGIAKLSLIAVLGTFLIIILSEIRLIGAPTDVESSSTIMNASVNQIVEITPSPEIIDGIQFGSVDAGTNDNDALGNTGFTGLDGYPKYNITIDPLTTWQVDLYQKAIDHLNHTTIADQQILIGNVTMEANTTVDTINNVNTTVTTDGSVALTLSWAAVGGAALPCDALIDNNACIMAFWLDVPGPIRGGTYNTSYQFCGVYSTGSSTLC
jgi:hypothetical protein